MTNQNQSFNAWQASQPAPAGFVPQGAPAAVAGPPAAPGGWGAAPPVAAPAGPPVGYAPPAGPPQGYAPPAPAAPTGGNVFGAGAFAGAAPVSERKDCQNGDYVFEIIKQEQYRTREGKPMFRTLVRVAHAYSGSQPVGSEVTDVIFLGYPGSDGFKYGCADMLLLATAALDCNSDHEARAKLNSMYPQAVNAQGQVDAWSFFADAMQDANQQTNPHVGPNPLKGKFYRAIITPGKPNPKKPGEFFQQTRRMRAVVGG